MNGDYEKSKASIRQTKCRCINRIFRAEYLDVDSYTVRDSVSGVTFIMCPRCYDRIKKLSGYHVVAYPRYSIEARRVAEKEAFKHIPF
jgi:hypothetical protein